MNWLKFHKIVLDLFFSHGKTTQRKMQHAISWAKDVYDMYWMPS